MGGTVVGAWRWVTAGQDRQPAHKRLAGTNKLHPLRAVWHEAQRHSVGQHDVPPHLPLLHLCHAQVPALDDLACRGHPRWARWDASIRG